MTQTRPKSKDSSKLFDYLPHLCEDSHMSNEEVLEGHVVVVTGAGQGIGAALAEYLAGQGASVVAADINHEKARNVVDKITGDGGIAIPMEVDVSSWDSCRDMVAATVREFRGLHGLVNNAGVLHLRSPFDEVDGDGARRVIEVNLLGTYNAGIAAIQHMGEHRGGSIVNVTSGVQAGLTGAASYGASKGGVASLTYSWALDCRDRDIRVNAISPVATTPMTIGTEDWQRKQGREVPSSDFIDPSFNCPAVGYFLSPLAEHVTGQVLRTHGDTLQLIGHPVVIPPELRRERWAVADVANAVDDVFVPLLPRLGMHAAHVQYV